MGAKFGKTYCIGIGLRWIRDQLKRSQIDGKPQKVLGIPDAEGKWTYVNYTTAYRQIENLIERGFDIYPCKHADKKGHCKGV